MERKTFRARDLPWAIMRLARKTLFSAPPVPWHLKIARLRSLLHGRFSRDSPSVRRNIEDVFGGELEVSQVDEIARRHHEMSKRLYLPWILPQHPRSKSPSLWPVRGREHLDEALSTGRGVILVTAHLGYVRMMAFILRVHGYQVVQVAARGSSREAAQERSDEWLSSTTEFRRYVYRRTRVTVDLIQPHHIPANLNVRPIFDALKSNQAVLIPGDGMRAAEFVEFPLLGRSYPFATGYMKIAMMTGSPVVPAFAVEEDGGRRIVVEIQPRLEVDPKASVGENLRLYVDALEAQLRRTPHQWHRWRAGEDCFEQALEWSRIDLRERYEAGSGTQVSSKFK